VEGLRRENFPVCSINGIEQPLTGFATIEEPAQVTFFSSKPARLSISFESSHVWAAYSLLGGLSAG